MRYWWVNQNQTFKHEFSGGYLWSPKRKANNSINPFYEFMREVAPGDLILSFVGTEIRAVAIAVSHAYPCPKPDEFGAVGQNWHLIGWKVDCHYHKLHNPIRPKDHIAVLRPLLPTKYAPLQASGDGLQGVYLTELTFAFIETVASLVGSELKFLMRGDLARDDLELPRAGKSMIEWEEQIRTRIEGDNTIEETEKRSIILARRGQGKFKDNVRKLESFCRVTKVDRIEHLRASHCKPWRDSDNYERISGENGLLLTPTIDHLFDEGFISFEDGGDLLVSPVAHGPSLVKMGIRVGERVNVGRFSDGQKHFLDYHRNEIFKEAQIKR